MNAPSTAPISGANQNSQSCDKAGVCANKATAVDRAGFTEVLVTGIEIKWIKVNPKPMAMGPKPAATRFEADPKIMI